MLLKKEKYFAQNENKITKIEKNVAENENGCFQNNFENFEKCVDFVTSKWYNLGARMDKLFRFANNVRV